MNAELWADAIKVYDRAWGYLFTTYDGAEFTQWLHRATLVGFHDGTFVIEVPDEYVRDVFSRNSEQHLIKNALESMMPIEWHGAVGIAFEVKQDVTGQGKQAVAEVDYLEVEGMGT